MDCVSRQSVIKELRGYGCTKRLGNKRPMR